MLQKLDKNLWTAYQSQKVAGVDFGTRMTVVRLSNGGLAVISPINPTKEIVSELNRRGGIHSVIAPNCFHYKYINAFHEVAKGAKYYAVSELKKKQPELHVDQVLADYCRQEWGSDLDYLKIAGTKSHEVVFFHPMSRSLIITDLAFNFKYVDQFLKRTVLRLLGAHNRFGPSRLSRYLIYSKDSFKKSLDEVFKWDFDRICLAHGDLVSSGGKAKLRQAFDWLD